MTKSIKAAALAVMFLLPSAGIADVLTLTPADPQPAEDSLSTGLAVAYSGKFGGRSLEEVRSDVKKWTPGPALAGLSYDTGEGDMVLSSDVSSKIAAQISGYIKFDEPGSYVLEFLSNDGLEISIGDQPVGLYDGVHSCGYVGEVEVDVPSAGYYALEATYFQRKGSACLLMEWGPDSDGLVPVPDSAFFH
ncbi:hypothetical protein KX928_10810 [Roseobacter sp. YSTF-M11]|uniref:PA14 domain-containing protein n=1 Tax=Roseobacter insulae TaxID=2859783 RepID=A0A9X1FVS8_9RHOB|nr:PA14 domain-containing protein [Roseobacter insulae]MBW4708274.1 hypothetical protein [Roseobacter insulae]